jgi:hypothetical protein
MAGNLEKPKCIHCRFVVIKNDTSPQLPIGKLMEKVGSTIGSNLDVSENWKHHCQHHLKFCFTLERQHQTKSRHFR